MKQRITIDFEFNDDNYYAAYDASFYDKKYLGHRLSKVVKSDDRVIGSSFVDRNLMMTYCLVGDGIEHKQPEFGYPNITGTMVRVDELNILLPHWLIKMDALEEE